MRDCRILWAGTVDVPGIWEYGMRALAAALLCLVSLAGCAVVALPFRVTGEVLDVVPVVGPIAAAPFKAAGDVID